MTKVDPPSPMKNLVTARDVTELTRPMHAHGIEAAMSTIPIKMRAPNLSHRGPRANLITIVPATEQILEVQMSLELMSRSPLTSESNGAMANQMKNARKKQNHEQWNARMWGLEKLHSLIEVALLF